MEIVDQPYLAQALAFKGGTCAAMLGFLDRFSVDLDFDLLEGSDVAAVRSGFRQAFVELGLEVLVEFDNALIFKLRYPTTPGRRNTIKVSANSLICLANVYRVQYFPEIDRLIKSQTIETMFANKLAAVLDRYERHGSVAGRDIYDIHHFFVQGYSYHAAVIRERTGLDALEYLGQLSAFIRDHITQTVINEDLNSLLPNQQFQKIRKILIPETLSLLEREQRKLRDTA